MTRKNTLALVFSAAALIVSFADVPTLRAQHAKSVVHLRVDLPKKSPWERDYGRGPVLLGPQTNIILDWSIHLSGSEDVILHPDSEHLRVRVDQAGAHIASRTSFAPEMKVNHRVTAVGPTAVNANTTITIRSQVARSDAAQWEPGFYRLTLDADELQCALTRRASGIQVDSGFQIELWIQPLASPTRTYHYHLLEAAFYSSDDPARALEHRIAIVRRPDASSIDWLALGHNYAQLGQHKSAVDAFRRVLPDVAKMPQHALEMFRTAQHFRRMAASFALVGDGSSAEALLRAQGLPRSQIPAAIEELRKGGVRPPPRE